MKYEYDFENIPLSEEDQAAMQVGIANLEKINGIIRDIINRRGADGWEALYPFSAPMLWFKKPKRATKKANVS